MKGGSLLFSNLRNVPLPVSLILTLRDIDKTARIKPYSDAESTQNQDSRNTIFTRLGEENHGLRVSIGKRLLNHRSW